MSSAAPETRGPEPPKIKQLFVLRRWDASLGNRVWRWFADCGHLCALTKEALNAINTDLYGRRFDNITVCWECYNLGLELQDV